jgi:hypothetical protein
MRLAGYDAPLADSFVTHLPVDRFADGATFEQFIAYFVEALYPEAEVRRTGGSGHAQAGIDVEANLPNGRRLVFQCKHVSRFGPADVRETVATYSAGPAEKYLVLSRVASPQAAEEVRRHEGWTLWDRDDLSRILRHKLSPDAQCRLVDIFFRGQRESILGRPERGAWLTPEEFFLPFSPAEAALSHNWELVGRDKELARLTAAAGSPSGPVTLLVAAGGMGKTRLLRALCACIKEAEPGTRIRFLSRESDLADLRFEELGIGPKLLVVDDAHDRNGLGALFQLIGNPANQARLIVATRPYAEQRICGEAAAYGILPDVVPLEPLPRNVLIELAVNVLEEFGGQRKFAEAVVEHAGDSPLSTTMIARIVARDGIPLERARSEAELRNVIMGKFARVVLGDVGQRLDEQLHRDLLDVLALVQPFHPADPKLISFIEATKGIPEERAASGLRTLVDGGIVFKRRGEHRLMPDLLGDYMIERSCIDVVGQLSPFAHKALARVPTTLLANLLVNLARLDWRRADGDPAKTRLLDTIWLSLENLADDTDPRFGAVRAVAMYQPRQALKLMAQLFQRGHRFAGMSEVLRTVALVDRESFRSACDLLWAMGRSDSRSLDQHPSHPIRILSELGEFKTHKPLEYSLELCDFAFDLIPNAHNWEGAHTPLELLKPLLRGDGEVMTSDMRSLSFAPFFVNYEIVKPLRARIIDKVLELLKDTRPSIARSAANLLQASLKLPRGTFGAIAPEGLKKSYKAEFAVTLKRLSKIVGHQLHPTTNLGIARSVNWHAKYGSGNCQKLARVVLNALPKDLEFRTIACLSDGNGRIFIDDKDPQRALAKQRSWLEAIANSLQRKHPDPEARRRAVEVALRVLKDSGDDLSSAYPLISVLLRSDVGFARAILEDGIKRRESPTRQYVAGALSSIASLSNKEIFAWSRRLMDTGDPELMQSAASGLGSLDGAAAVEAVPTLRELLAGPPRVVESAIWAACFWEQVAPRIVIDLVLASELHGSSTLADKMAMALIGPRRKLVDHLSEDDLDRLLAKLEPIPQLEGYWLDELLAELSLKHPLRLADFFMARVELVARTKNLNFRTANYGPYSQEPLKFLEAKEGLFVLRRVWKWLTQNEGRDEYFRSAASEMFDAMFLHRANVVVDLLSPQLDTLAPPELKLLARLLREAPREFVFTQSTFVVRFLERCSSFDPGLAKEAASSFFASASSGIRSGKAGEPMPDDIEQLKGAKEVLSRLSLTSPAYELYDWIRQSAERNISEACADAEVFADG